MAVVGELSVLLSLIPKDFDAGLNLINRLSTAAKALLGVQAMKSVLGWVESTSDAAIKLQKMSSAMGMSMEQTQLWSFVAQQSGSNVTQLAQGVGLFEENLRKLAHGQGGKELAANMAALGIHSREAKVALSGPDGLQKTLLAVADTAHKMGNNGATVGLFRETFGARAGAAFLSDISKGSAGLQELFEKRKQMGLLDQKDVTNLKTLGNEMKNVGGTFQAMGALVLAKLAPKFIEMANAAQKWLAENKDVISGVFETALKGVAFAFEIIGTAVDVLVKMGKWVKGFFDDVKDGSVGATAALSVFGWVVGSIVVPIIIKALQRLALAIVLDVIPAIWAMTAALWASPITWILALIMLVVGAAYLLIKHWGAVKAFFAELWESISNGLSTTWNWVKRIGGDILDFFVGIWDGIGDALKAVFEWMRHLPIIEQILDAIDWAASKMGDGNNGKEEAPWYEKLAGAVTGTSGIINAVQAPTANVPAGSGGSANPSGLAPSSSPINQTININGVTGADKIPHAIGKAGDELSRRHASAGLGGR